MVQFAGGGCTLDNETVTLLLLLRRRRSTNAEMYVNIWKFRGSVLVVQSAAKVLTPTRSVAWTVQLLKDRIRETITINSMTN